VLPECFVQIKNNKVRVQLNNISAKPVSIQPKQKIGCYEEGYVVDAQGRTRLADEVTQKREKTESKLDLQGSVLSKTQQNHVNAFLNGWSDVFAMSPMELGTMKSGSLSAKHLIRLTDNTPFKDRARKRAPAMRDEIKQYVLTC